MIQKSIKATIILIIASVVLSQPQNQADVQEDFSTWPIDSEQCLRHATAALEKKQQKCRDLSGVILTTQLGATENYINSCITGLIEYQKAYGVFCKGNIKFYPRFDLKYEKCPEENSSKSAILDIQSHCTKMGNGINWFTQCGAPEHYNKCVDSFYWYFSKNSISCKKNINTLIPYQELSEFCKSMNLKNKTQQACIDMGQNTALTTELKCMKKVNKNNTPLCEFYKIRDLCRLEADKVAKEWSTTCSGEVTLIRTLDNAPSECAYCVEKANLILKTILEDKIPDFKNDCLNWLVQSNSIRDYQIRASYYQNICGKKSGLVIAQQKPAPRPNNCKMDSPLKCEKKARKVIGKNFEKCQKDSEKIKDTCKRFGESIRCWSKQMSEGQDWSILCKTQLLYPIPSVQLPPECQNGENNSLPKVKDPNEDEIVKDATKKKSCTQNGLELVNKSVDDCLDKTKTMRFTQCGLLNYRNSCYLQGIKEQFKQSEVCGWDWVQFKPTTEFELGCYPEKCSDTAKETLTYLDQICVESVKFSRMNECAKAKTINTCLKGFEWVVMYWNQTCTEKILLSLPLADEKSLCGDQD